jgi:hypothetical protein
MKTSVGKDVEELEFLSLPVVMKNGTTTSENNLYYTYTVI